MKKKRGVMCDVVAFLSTLPTSDCGKIKGSDECLCAIQIGVGPSKNGKCPSEECSAEVFEQGGEKVLERWIQGPGKKDHVLTSQDYAH